MPQDDLQNQPTLTDELEDDLGPGDDPSLLYEDVEDELEEEDVTPEPDEAVAPEAVADELTEAVTDEPPKEEEILPPSNYKSQLPENLYTDEERQWLLRAMDDPDPETRFQAEEFRTARRIEYNNRALLVAQAQMASVPQQFAAVHGPVIAEYLNTRVSPERRGTTEALKEAQHYAVFQRGLQVGDTQAFKEAYELMSGKQLNVPIQVPAPTPPPAVVHKAPAAPKQPIAPGARMPTSQIVASPVTPPSRTRGERAYERTLSGLGIEE